MFSFCGIIAITAGVMTAIACTRGVTALLGADPKKAARHVQYTLKLLDRDPLNWVLTPETKTHYAFIKHNSKIQITGYDCGDRYPCKIDEMKVTKRERDEIIKAINLVLARQMEHKHQEYVLKQEVEDV